MSCVHIRRHVCDVYSFVCCILLFFFDGMITAAVHAVIQQELTHTKNKEEEESG